MSIPPKHPDARTMMWPGLDVGKTNIEEQLELASTEVPEGLLGNQVRVWKEAIAQVGFGGKLRPRNKVSFSELRHLSLVARYLCFWRLPYLALIHEVQSWLLSPNCCLTDEARSRFYEDSLLLC